MPSHTARELLGLDQGNIINAEVHDVSRPLDMEDRSASSTDLRSGLAFAASFCGTEGDHGPDSDAIGFTQTNTPPPPELRQVLVGPRTIPATVVGRSPMMGMASHTLMSPDGPARGFASPQTHLAFGSIPSPPNTGSAVGNTVAPLSRIGGTTFQAPEEGFDPFDMSHSSSKALSVTRGEGPSGSYLCDAILTIAQLLQMSTLAPSMSEWKKKKIASNQKLAEAHMQYYSTVCDDIATTTSQTVDLCQN